MKAQHHASFKALFEALFPTAYYSAERIVDLRELHRVTRPGGYLICTAANRYRTALQLVRGKDLGQLASVLDIGRCSRRIGLVDHRFNPCELTDLFRAGGWDVLHLVGICPLFPCLPAAEPVSLLNDESALESMRDVERRYAQDPAVVGISDRLLTAARRG